MSENKSIDVDKLKKEENDLIARFRLSKTNQLKQNIELEKKEKPITTRLEDIKTIESETNKKIDKLIETVKETKIEPKSEPRIEPVNESNVIIPPSYLDRLNLS